MDSGDDDMLRFRSDFVAARQILAGSFYIIYTAMKKAKRILNV